MDTKTRTIAFAHFKGGTGKTTSCINMAAALARQGKRILVVDLDPQANATTGLGLSPHSVDVSAYDLLFDYCQDHATSRTPDAIVQTKITNVDIIAAEFDLSVAELLLARIEHRHEAMTHILASVQEQYDFIMCDLPSSGVLMLNGLYFAKDIIVPVDTSIFAINALQNLQSILEDLKQLDSSQIKNTTIFLTKTPKPRLFGLFGKSPTQLEAEAAVRSNFNSVYAIPLSDNVYEAQKLHQPLVEAFPEDPATTAYLDAARHLYGPAQPTPTP